MNENREARKKTGCLCRKIARIKEREKKSFSLSCFQRGTKENYPSNLYGWNEIKMYHKKELLQ